MSIRVRKQYANNGNNKGNWEDKTNNYLTLGLTISMEYKIDIGMSEICLYHLDAN